MFVLVQIDHEFDEQLSLVGVYEELADARREMRELYDEESAGSHGKRNHCGDWDASTPEVEWHILDKTYNGSVYLR